LSFNFVQNNLRLVIRQMHNTGLEKVAVQCSAETFVLDQRFVFSFDICGENSNLRQTEKRQR